MNKTKDFMKSAILILWHIGPKKSRCLLIDVCSCKCIRLRSVSLKQKNAFFETRTAKNFVKVNYLLAKIIFLRATIDLKQITSFAKTKKKIFYLWFVLSLGINHPHEMQITVILGWNSRIWHFSFIRITFICPPLLKNTEHNHKENTEMFLS